MLFSSAVFLFAFLPLSLLAYYVMPGREARNVALVVLSLVFYAWGDPTCLVLLIVDVVVTWALGRVMRGASRPCLYVVLAIVFNVGMLVFYKYESFFAQNLGLLGVPLPDLALPLPVGISYYTLKLVTYAVDVYRGTLLLWAVRCILPCLPPSSPR